MRKTVFRSLRQSLSRLSTASAQVAITVDNIAKSITISGESQWKLPFEWVLDHDSGLLDANSQRGCVISPELTNQISALETKVVEKECGALEVHVEWDHQTTEGTTSCGTGIPATTPSRSTFVIPSTAQASVLTPEEDILPPQSIHQLQTSRALWRGRELYSGSADTSLGPPKTTIVPDFFTNPSKSKRDVILTVERYGFAVAEDATLSAVIGCSTPAVVQHRCDIAERMIREVFPVLRNSHYGAMSTWSDGDGWKQVPHDAQSSPADHASFRESGSHLDGAYMSSHLDLHTDGTYFLESPKLQSYGCIFTTPSTVGGETTIADGFAAAMQLKEEDAEAFSLLCRMEVGGRYRKEGLWYEAHRPVLSMCRGKLSQISFNNSDRMPMSSMHTPATLRKFYAAYYKLHKIVHANSITFQLKPGQMLFFDNHRALHGRQQFAGPRVMCGAYVGLDDYYSSLLMAESTIIPK